LRSGITIEKADHDTPKRRDAHEVSGMGALTTPMFATHVGEVRREYEKGKEGGGRMRGEKKSKSKP
jgi:hypothetical protein